MNISFRCANYIVLLVPIMLPACAHRYSELAQGNLPRPPEPSIRLKGSSLRARGKSTDAARHTTSQSVAVRRTDANAKTRVGDSLNVGERNTNRKKIRLVTHDVKESEPANLPTLNVDQAEFEPEQPKQITKKVLSLTIPPAPTMSVDDATSNMANSELTMAELEQIALESNPSLIQLAAVVEKARGIHEQVGLYPNPVMGYSGTEIGNDGAAGQQGGFISQTIITGNKLRLSRDVANWSIQELSWEYQAQRHRVLNDVRLRYYDVIGAKQRLKIADDLFKVAEDGAKIAEQLRKAKQASRADVLQTQVDLTQIRIIRQNARYDYDASWKRLAAVMGRPQMKPMPLAGSLKSKEELREWESTYQKLLDESPQLQAVRARVQGAQLAIRRQEVQPIPNLLTQFGMARDYGSGDVITNIQIGIPLPMFNRNQGNIRLAQADYQRAVRNAERIELQLRDRLATAFRSFQQAKFQVEQYEKNILTNAGESRKLTEESYKAGQVNFLRVLTARRTFFEANLRYVDALIALRQADVVIDGFVLTGGLIDVPDIGSRPFSGPGQRGQALSGQ